MTFSALASAAATQPTSSTTSRPSVSTAPSVPVIRLTPAAANEVKKIIKEQKLAPSVSLRIGVKANGAEFSYVFDLTETAATKDDTRFDEQGISILMDQKAILFLQGTVVDFRDGATGRGFVFRNPNTTTKSAN